MNRFQIEELNILKEVLKILKKYNLRYYAIGGTCIGAIRHKGFIPWDDDIDIAMPREDYELFRKQYYKELPDHIVKLDYDNSRHHSFIFFKIHNDQTTMVDHYAERQPDRFTGAFVDIMPVDGLPSHAGKRSIVINGTKLLMKLNTISRWYDLFPRTNMGTAQYFKDCIKKIAGFFLRRADITAVIERIIGKNRYDDSSDICFTWRIGMVELDRVVFCADWFRETLSVPFEDIMINVPKEFDMYLKQDFGDYMTLPPEGERNSGHDSYIYDLTKPCSYYAQIERNKK